MIDLFHAFLVQKHELEMRSRKTEHLYWDPPPADPWFTRVWRLLRARLQRPAQRHSQRTGAPGWRNHLDTPHGEPTP